MIATSTVWLDARGYTRVALVRTASGGIGAILPALQAVSNADWQQCWEGPVSTQTPAPVAALYESNSQLARLVFAAADNSQCDVLIYAPKSSIFLTDGVTVDDTNTDVASLITELLANGVSPTGSALTTYLGGFMQPTSGG